MSFARYYKHVKSSNNVSISNFNSEIPFECKTGTLEYVVTLKSFLSIRLVIAKNDTAGALPYTSPQKHVYDQLQTQQTQIAILFLILLKIHYVDYLIHDYLV